MSSEEHARHDSPPAAVRTVATREVPVDGGVLAVSEVECPNAQDGALVFLIRFDAGTGDRPDGPAAGRPVRGWVARGSDAEEALCMALSAIGGDRGRPRAAAGEGHFWLVSVSPPWREIDQAVWTAAGGSLWAGPFELPPVTWEAKPCRPLADACAPAGDK